MPANMSRIKILKNPHYKPSGIKSYAYCLHKYNIGPTIDGPYCTINKVHQQGSQAILSKFKTKVGGRAHVQGHVLAKKDSAGRTGEIPSEDIQNDSLYLTPVTIGTPGQKLNLDFDTGSADLWVWSTKLPSQTVTKGKQSGHSIFDPSESSTWKPASGSTWQIQYGDGSQASGTVGNDSLNLGGLVVEQQAIELADTLSAQFQSGAGDGLLGLAFGNINTVQPTPVATPVENMITQSDIPASSELFTAYLGSYKDASDPDGGESFYTFGFIDQDVVASTGSEIHYVDVDSSQGFWSFPSTSASVNGKTVTRTGNTAIADTGTTLALVDDKTVEAIYAAIPGAKQDYQQQGYVFPSDTQAADLPVVQFAVGDKLFTLQKEDLGFADAGNGMTFGSIQSRGDQSFDILGDAFLKSVYAVFDQGNKRFGVVQRVDGTQDVGTPAAAGGSGS